MRELRELTLLVNPLEITSFTKSLISLEEESLLGKYFRGILQGEFQADESAQNALYPDKDSTNSYRKLKSLLKSRLKDAVLFFDEKKRTKTPYQKAYYRCYKEWAIVKILLGQNAREAAVDVAEGILSKAIKFEFSDLVMDVASVLRLHYGARLGDRERFNRYNALFKEYQEKYWWEEKARELYIDLVMNYVNCRSTNHEAQHLMARRALAELDEAAAINKQSRQFLLCYYLIEVTSYTSVHDYQRAIDVCRRAIDTFTAKGFDVKLPLQVFYYQQLLCHIQLGQFEEGQEVAKTCLVLIEEGTFNWFKYYELYTILAFHTHNYQQALYIYQETVSHHRFDLLPENVVEIWKVYQAYLEYLYLAGTIDQAPAGLNGKHAFDLDDFLSSFEFLSKDKGGVNIAIIIVQILLLLLEKDYDLATNKIEAAQKYRYRHLEGEGKERTAIFFKMLQKIPLGGFRRDEVAGKAAKLADQLAQMPLDVAGQDVEIEIIPYENLWELILDTLS